MSLLGLQLTFGALVQLTLVLVALQVTGVVHVLSVQYLLEKYQEISRVKYL